MGGRNDERGNCHGSESRRPYRTAGRIGNLFPGLTRGYSHPLLREQRCERSHSIFCGAISSPRRGPCAWMGKACGAGVHFSPVSESRPGAPHPFCGTCFSRPWPPAYPIVRLKFMRLLTGSRPGSGGRACFPGSAESGPGGARSFVAQSAAARLSDASSAASGALQGRQVCFIL
jgi:hypothetical protein